MAMTLPMPPQNMPAEVYAYLFQMVQLLNMASDSISAGTVVQAGSSGGTSGMASGNSANADVTAYNELRSLIIKTADTVHKEMDQLSTELKGSYVAQSDFGTYVEQLNAYIEANPDSISQYYSFASVLDSSIKSVDEKLTLTNEDVAGLGLNIEDLDKSLQITDKNVEQLGESLTATDKNVETLGENLQSTDKNVDALGDDVKKVEDDFVKYTVETKGYIRTGIVLYENGLPQIGVAVGQDLKVEKQDSVDGKPYDVIKETGFRSIFTAKELSFWQDDVKVAYLNNKQLYVTNIVALEKIKLGSWHVGSEDGFFIRWIGGTV